MKLVSIRYKESATVAQRIVSDTAAYKSYGTTFDERSSLAGVVFEDDSGNKLEVMPSHTSYATVLNLKTNKTERYAWAVIARIVTESPEVPVMACAYRVTKIN